MTRPKTHFGSMLRERRLQEEYSLRKFAGLVGISPTYLSLVEQGKLESPPTAERVRKMAELLHENPDHWIALAGRMPKDVEQIIKKQPEQMPAVLRALKGYSQEELRKLVEDLEKKQIKGKR